MLICVWGKLRSRVFACAACACACVGVEPRCSCEKLCKCIAAVGIEETPGYVPHTRATSYCSLSTTHHCLLHMKSFSVSLCLLLSLCCVFNVPACINVSRPPYPLLIYEFYPALSLLPPGGSIDGPICRVCHQKNRLVSTNIMNILLTTCGLQHLRFR